jgi:hypothetical protein
MVIGEHFAWAHLPKAGGSATTELFRLFPELIVFEDVDHSNDKHTLFSERAQQVEGKVLAMNLRRLPFWVLSRAQHVARWGKHPEYRPIPMDSPKALSESSFPDTRLALFTGHGRFSIDRWIRMEALSDDFLTFISEWTDVSPERAAKVRGLAPVNALNYDHEIDHWFTQARLETMYRSNPRWAALERRLYGDLFSIS